MAVNKNFVVKNGLEVDTNLILADSTTNKVGIGTTVPTYELHVNGGIGATSATISGFATALQGLRVGTAGTVLTVLSSPGIGYSVGVGSSQPEYLLDVRSPVSTGQTALYVKGDVRITGDLVIEDDLTLDEVNIRNLNVTGLSTFVGFTTFQNNVYIAGVTTLAANGGITTTGGDLYVGGNLYGGGGITIDTDLYIIGFATVGTLDVNNNANIDGNLLVTGLSTFVGFSTFSDYVTIQDGLVNAGVTTSNAYTINGTQVVSSSRELQNIASLDATTTATIEAAIANGPNTFTDITVTGVSTFVGLATFNGGVEVVSGITTLGGFVDINNNVDISGTLNVSGISTLVGFATFQNDVYVAGVVTATSFYGDGSNLTGTASGLTATIGVGSESTFVGAGVTEVYFATTTGTNVNVVAAGTSATVTITPGVSLGLAIALGG